MTKEHIKDKFFGRVDRVAFRIPDDLKEELFQFAKEKGLLDTEYTSDILLQFMRNKNGVGKLEIEEEENDHFDCNKLCKKARQCTSQAMDHLGEVKSINCYVSKYPYEWTTPDGRTVRVCKYMRFLNGFPDDEENPYPECIHPRPPIHLPKDRIIRDPQTCWTCYKLQKRAREEELVKNALRADNYRGQPRIDMGKSAGLPPWY